MSLHHESMSQGIILSCPPKSSTKYIKKPPAGTSRCPYAHGRQETIAACFHAAKSLKSLPRSFESWLANITHRSWDSAFRCCLPLLTPRLENLETVLALEHSFMYHRSSHFAHSKLRKHAVRKVTRGGISLSLLTQRTLTYFGARLDLG